MKGAQRVSRVEYRSIYPPYVEITQEHPLQLVVPRVSPSISPIIEVTPVIHSIHICRALLSHETLGIWRLHQFEHTI